MLDKNKFGMLSSFSAYKCYIATSCNIIIILSRYTLFLKIYFVIHTEFSFFCTLHVVILYRATINLICALLLISCFLIHTKFLASCMRYPILYNSFPYFLFHHACHSQINHIDIIHLKSIFISIVALFYVNVYIVAFQI